MSAPPKLNEFTKNPEAMRWLSDADIRALCAEAAKDLSFLFTPGCFVEEMFHDLPDAFPDKVMDWAIALDSGEHAGQIMVVPELPRDLLAVSKILTEESLIRQLATIAEGILADMVVRPTAYAALWQSYGEYNVWERQFETKLAREGHKSTRETGESRPTPPREAVMEFRSSFAKRVAVGEVRAQSTSAIISTGISLFGRKYECTAVGDIHSMLVRFGSKLRYGTNKQLESTSPFSFTPS